MRTKTFVWLVFIIPAFFSSCKKDEKSSDLMNGSLTINIGVFISVNEEEQNLKSTLGSEDFKVTVFNNANDEILVFERASDVPEVVELEPGQYYVTAHSNNNLPAGFENPYYFGKSSVFTIAPGGQQSVTVNCELANTLITIIYSEQLKSNYTDYVATVSTSAGSLTFGKNEIRAGYFQPLPININVELTWQKGDGTFESKMLSGSIPDPLPKKKYEIHIDAGPAEGSALFQIVLDETVDPVEIVNITGSDMPPVSGPFNNGDLIISEIMYNPTTLADPEGEWFEIYNTTDATLDLNQLVIRRSDVDEHIINKTLLLRPHGYLVLCRAETSVSGTKYVYGSDVSLTNSSVVLSLYNYGTNGEDGSLIFSISYRAAGFPSGEGASICLSPLLLNPVDASLAGSWCTSVTAYSTGDLGTPGSANDACL